MYLLVKRANICGIINDSTAQDFYVNAGKAGWRKNEPLDNILVSPVPSLFIDAVDVLLTNNVFTPKEFVAELSELGLAMNPDELETLLNLNNNTLNDKACEPAKIVMLKTIKGRYGYDTN